MVKKEKLNKVVHKIIGQGLEKGGQLDWAKDFPV